MWGIADAVRKEEKRRQKELDANYSGVELVASEEPDVEMNDKETKDEREGAGSQDGLKTEEEESDSSAVAEKITTDPSEVDDMFRAEGLSSRDGWLSQINNHLPGWCIQPYQPAEPKDPEDHGFWCGDCAWCGGAWWGLGCPPSRGISSNHHKGRV